MSLPVVAGASLLCPFAMAPASLIVVPQGPLNLVEGKPAATIMDFQPFVNIPSFGVCQSLTNPATATLTAAAMGVLTPGPCTPITTPWAPGSSTVLLGGKPALTNTSKCQCAYGGSITITYPGTAKEQIP